MKNIKKFLTKKNANTAAIAMAALSVLYVLIFFARRCFDLSKSMKYNLYFCIPLFCMIFAIVYVSRLFVKNKEYSYSRVYVVLALCWGIAMQFVMPPISGADEPNHVYSVFHAADLLMGMQDGNRENDAIWIPGDSYFLLRQDEFNGIALIDLNFPEQYEIIANGGWFKCVGSEYVKCTYPPNDPYRYVFSALGIVIARLLGFGFSGTIMLGRLMNTLMFVVVGWFVVKLLPFGKLQAILYSLFPAVLNLTNSYSYDNLSIMFSMLLFALCLHYSKENVKVHIWDFIILNANLLMLAPNKTVYLCFFVWIFAIPLKKWWKIVTSKKWYEYVGIISILVAAKIVVEKFLWKYVYVALNNTIWKDESYGIEQDISRDSFNWSDLSNNTWEIIKFAINGVRKDFWYNIKHVVGCELGLVKLNAPVPLFCTLIFMLVVVLSYFVLKGKIMPKRQLIFFMAGTIFCLLGIFIGCLIRFTPSEGTDHVQISYRYVEPVYMALILMFGKDTKENRSAIMLIFIENLALIITMCHILAYMFTR